MRRRLRERSRGSETGPIVSAVLLAFVMSVGSLGVIPGVQAEAVEALIGARAALETPGDAVLMHGSRRSYIREKKTVAVRQINTI